MSRYDVVVVGGGPIGSVAARSAAAFGARVLLIERRTSLGGTSPCTGLVSPRTLPALGASDSSVLRRIRAVEAHAPNGHRLILRASTDKAFVLDRPTLERELHQRASEAGVTVQMNSEAVVVEPGRVDVRSPGGAEAIEAGVIIVAFGLSGAISSSGSFPRPRRLFLATQAVVESTPREPDEVCIYFGTDVAPHFFAWSVPASQGRMRVGLAVPDGQDPTARLSGFLKRRFPGAPVLSWASGRIPVGPIHDPLRDGILLVGDAAGQVKPLSGGGLYTGAICGRIAGYSAARAARQGQTSRQDLSSYCAACERAVGGEIRFGLAARDLLESLPNDGIDDAFDALDQSELLRFFASEGDIDRLRVLPRRLAGKRTLWKRLLPLLTLLDRHMTDHDIASPLPR